MCRQCELTTLTFDLGGHAWRLWLMRVIVLHSCTKFEVRRSCHSENIAHDVLALMGLVTLTF